MDVKKPKKIRSCCRPITLVNESRNLELKIMGARLNVNASNEILLDLGTKTVFDELLPHLASQQCNI